jgi:WhiB family redox-sensing transcriptional regulator
MARAACRDADCELFFPLGPVGPGAVSAREAKSVCETCPVREPCLEYALTHGCADGVWGGLTELERRALRRRGRS